MWPDFASYWASVQVPEPKSGAEIVRTQVPFALNAIWNGAVIGRAGVVVFVTVPTRTKGSAARAPQLVVRRTPNTALIMLIKSYGSQSAVHVKPPAKTVNALFRHYQHWRRN